MLVKLVTYFITETHCQDFKNKLEFLNLREKKEFFESMR